MRVCFRLSLVIILLFSSVIMIYGGKPSPWGAFIKAEFIPPDVSNGDTLTVELDGTVLFNYSCTCDSYRNGCSGIIQLQKGDGAGSFSTIASSTCSAPKNGSCSASGIERVSVIGTVPYRIVCDEADGGDFVQPAEQHVWIDAQGCSPGETRSCPLQEGVCTGTEQVCGENGTWGPCDYGEAYRPEDGRGCDQLDNDCDGLIDEIDQDGDGASPCGPVSGIENEVLILGLESDRSFLAIRAFNPSSQALEVFWSDSTSNSDFSLFGASIGDLTGDGVNEFVALGRENGEVLQSRPEVWAFDKVNKTWSQIWVSSQYSSGFSGIGGIEDVDQDGINEFLYTAHRIGIQVWGFDGNTFQMEYQVRDGDDCRFIKTACDINGNGIPEVVTQCTGEDIIIYEWGDSGYPEVGNISMDILDGSILDHMDCADLDNDGLNETLLCGNTKRSHILEYDIQDGYEISFQTEAASSCVESCDITDINHDGQLDWIDTYNEGMRVFTYRDGEYTRIWDSGDVGWIWGGAVGGGTAGDIDLDGFNEYIVRLASEYRIELWENDQVDTVKLEKTRDWSGVLPLIGNLNPTNDVILTDCNDGDALINSLQVDVCGDGVDQDCDGADTECDCQDLDGDSYDGFSPSLCPTGGDCEDRDASVNPDADEVCDGLDNNCNGIIDENCSVCGDGICAGLPWEDAFSCSMDCPCIGPNCVQGNCGDGICSRKESAEQCPIDCGGF